MKRIKERLVFWTLATYLVLFVCLIPVGYFVNQLEGTYAANLTFVVGLVSLVSFSLLSAIWTIYGTGNFAYRFFLCGFVFLLAGLAFEQSRCLMFWGENYSRDFSEWWIGDNGYLPMFWFLPVWCVLIVALSTLRVIPFLRWKIKRFEAIDDPIVKQSRKAVSVRATMLVLCVLGTYFVWNRIFNLSLEGMLIELTRMNGAETLVYAVSFFGVSLLSLVMMALTRCSNWLFYQRQWFVRIVLVSNSLMIGLSIRFASDPENIHRDWHVVWILCAAGLLVFQSLLTFGISGYRIQSKAAEGKKHLSTGNASGTGLVIKPLLRFHPLEQLICLGFLSISGLVIPTGFHQKLVIQTWAQRIRFDETGEIVELLGSDIPNEFKFLEGNSRLESLLLGSDDKETFASKQALDSLIELNGTLNSGFKKLEFHNCRFDDSAFKFLLQFPLVEELRLNQTNISDDDIIYLKSLRNLKHLYLGSTNVSGKGIGQLESLETLHVGGTKVTGEPIDQFDSLKKLKTIYMTDNAFSAEAKRHLYKTHPGIHVYDEFWKMLGTPNPLLLSVMVQRNSEGYVTALNLTGKKSYYGPLNPGKGFIHSIAFLLNYARQFPKLRALNLARTGMNDETLLFLDELKALEHVDLSGNEVSNIGMGEIVKLTQLKVLMLNDTKISDEGLIDLKRLKDLELLSLNNTDISSSSVARLNESVALKWLMLADTNLNDDDMATLSQLSGLEEISVAGCPITDEGVSHLEKLTNLKIIDLKGTAITDAGLESLKPLVNLQIIYLANTDVTKIAIAELQKILPNCVIEVASDNSVGLDLELLGFE